MHAKNINKWLNNDIKLLIMKHSNMTQ